jgi:hypothetical protein
MNKLTTTRRTKDGHEVMDNYDLVRKWAKASGQQVRKHLTPEKMAEYDALRKKDQKAAEEKFDDVVKNIRETELNKLLR